MGAVPQTSLTNQQIHHLHVVRPEAATTRWKIMTRAAAVGTKPLITTTLLKNLLPSIRIVNPRRARPKLRHRKNSLCSEGLWTEDTKGIWRLREGCKWSRIASHYVVLRRMWSWKIKRIQNQKDHKAPAKDGRAESKNTKLKKGLGEMHCQCSEPSLSKDNRLSNRIVATAQQILNSQISLTQRQGFVSTI